MIFKTCTITDGDITSQPGFAPILLHQGDKNS